MVKDGWKRYSTAEIGTFAKGSGISREQSNSGNLPAVRYGELYTTHNYYIREFASHISSDVALQAHKIGYGDLLFTCSGETKEEIGKCVAVVTNTEAYAGGDLIIITPTCKMHPLFMGYVLNTPQVIHQRAQLAQGDSIVHISTESIKSLEFDAPEYPEQCRIAEVLSDIDELILDLEKLISKKKDIRNGAMQQLLTGKQRLSGFDDEWDIVVLGKYCSVVRGGSPRPIQDFLTTGEGINWIKIGDVSPDAKYITSTQERIIEDGVSMSRMVYKGDLILSNSMSFGRPYILKLDGCIHDGWLAIQNYQATFDRDYLFYVLSSEYVFLQYIQLAAGSSVQNLNKEKVESLEVYRPKNRNEQEAIASILSDMDVEIDLLYIKLEKYKELKAGMMDELLTGNIRI